MAMLNDQRVINTHLQAILEYHPGTFFDPLPLLSQLRFPSHGGFPVLTGTNGDDIGPIMVTWENCPWLKNLIQFQSWLF